MSAPASKKQKVQPDDVAGIIADTAKQFLYGEKHILIQDKEGKNLFQLYPVLLKKTYNAVYRRVWDPDVDDYEPEKDVEFSCPIKTVIVRAKKWCNKKQQWGDYSSEVKMEAILHFAPQFTGNYPQETIKYKISLQPEGWEVAKSKSISVAFLDNIVANTFPNVKIEVEYETQQLSKVAVLKKLVKTTPTV